MTKESGLFIDHGNKIIFDVQTAIPAPANCPDGKIYPTEYKEFYLTKSKDYRKSVDILKIANFISNRDNYLAFSLERKKKNKQNENAEEHVYSSIQGGHNDTIWLR